MGYRLRVLEEHVLTSWRTFSDASRVFKISTWSNTSVWKYSGSTCRVCRVGVF